MKISLCNSLFFVLCLACIVGLSSVRSHPVYGKLDFLLLDGRPWWQPWRSMIESILQAGDKPVLSDVVTDRVLRAVFAQQTVNLRCFRRYRINIDTMLAMNKQQVRNAPVGALFVLLQSERNTHQSDPDVAEQEGEKTSLVSILTDAALKIAEQRAELPYRCLINLHGFTPSWVPDETGHWSAQWGETAWFYSLNGITGKGIGALLQDNPPENCTVYF